MEENIKCKELKAIFSVSKPFAGRVVDYIFNIDDDFTVELHQSEERYVSIISNAEKTCRELYGVFTKVERLLFILDGRFFELKELSFFDLNGDKTEKLISLAENYYRNRVSFYSSADFCKYSFYRFVSYEEVITKDLFIKWDKLLDELDIVNQMFLYAVSDNKMPIDVKCAFLIELSEPLVEIVKSHTHFYSSLRPGERGTSLKMCIDALITKYGTYIFDTEINANYDKFLQIIVNSRVRIMHIKRNQSGIFLNGNESLLYAQKFMILYRRIIFVILGIDEDLYRDNIIRTVERLDSWNDILDRFKLKIQ